MAINNVGDWLSRNPMELVPLVAIGGAFIVAAIAIVAGVWAKVHRTESLARRAEWEAALKRDMINRGMSAEEIERVLAATQSGAAVQSGAGSCYSK